MPDRQPSTAALSLALKVSLLRAAHYLLLAAVYMPLIPKINKHDTEMFFQELKLRKTAVCQ